MATDPRKQILYLEKLKGAQRALEAAERRAGRGDLDVSLQLVNDAGSYLVEALALGEELRG